LPNILSFLLPGTYFPNMDGDGFLSDVFMLNTETLEWTELTDQISGIFPSGRWGHGFVHVNNKLLLFGGFSGLGAEFPLYPKFRIEIHKSN